MNQTKPVLIPLVEQGLRDERTKLLVSFHSENPFSILNN